MSSGGRTILGASFVVPATRARRRALVTAPTARTVEPTVAATNLLLTPMSASLCQRTRRCVQPPRTPDPHHLPSLGHVLDRRTRVDGPSPRSLHWTKVAGVTAPAGLPATGSALESKRVRSFAGRSVDMLSRSGACRRSEDKRSQVEPRVSQFLERVDSSETTSPAVSRPDVKRCSTGYHVNFRCELHDRFGGFRATPRLVVNQSRAKTAASASVPGSSNRWVAPGTTTRRLVQRSRS